MGIYPNMKSDKQNKLISDDEPTLAKSSAHKAEVKSRTMTMLRDSSENKMPTEINGPKGPEPTRYGDWEQKGRCTDF